MKYLGAMQQSWFVTGVVGASVAPIVPPFVASGVVLVGLILLVYEKDRRFPQHSLLEACWAFRHTHVWSRAWGWAAVSMTGYGVVLTLASQSRGIYLACLGVYAAIYFAVPIRAGGSDAPVGS